MGQNGLSDFDDAEEVCFKLSEIALIAVGIVSTPTHPNHVIRLLVGMDWSYLMSSAIPASIYPALLTRTSICSFSLRIWAVMAWISAGEAVTSRVYVFAPALASVLIRETEPRVVAIALSPRARMRLMRISPKPEEHPVTSHVI